MRIVILTQYYPPEVGAPQRRLSDLAERLTRMGHQVVVATAMPNYPEGRVHPEYRGRWLARETRGGVQVLRSWIYATPSRRLLPWAAHYASFVASSLLAGIFRMHRADIVLTESPPLFLGLSGWLLARAKGARFVLNVADPWLKAGISAGVLKGRAKIGFMKRLEDGLYRAADLITGQTAGIVEDARARVEPDRALLFPNGVDVDRFRPDVADPALAHELGLEGRFVVGYAGLHGPFQRLGTVLDAAERVRDLADVRFAFFGDGPEKPRLVEEARRRGLDNVRFHAVLPGERIPGLLPLWDVGLVPLAADPIMAEARPSKMFELMAAGVPVLLSAPNGEASRILEDSGCGLHVPAERPEAMETAIRRLHGDRSRREALGGAGRRTAERRFDRQRIAEDLQASFEGLLAGT